MRLIFLSLKEITTSNKAMDWRIILPGHDRESMLLQTEGRLEEERQGKATLLDRHDCI
jgi:hypothetical protein